MLKEPKRILLTGASGLIGSRLAASLEDAWPRGHSSGSPARQSRRTSTDGTPTLDPWTNELSRVSTLSSTSRVPASATNDGRQHARQRSTTAASGPPSSSPRASPPPTSAPTSSSPNRRSASMEIAATKSSPRTPPLGTDDDFLSSLTIDWEAAADPPVSPAIRVVHPRTGLVLARDAQLMRRLVPLCSRPVWADRSATVGNGGVGSPSTMLSAPSTHLIDSDLAGPVNLVAPTRSASASSPPPLPAQLRRPSKLPVPRIGMRLALGGEKAEIDRLLEHPGDSPAPRGRRLPFRSRRPAIGAARRGAMNFTRPDRNRETDRPATGLQPHCDRSGRSWEPLLALILQWVNGESISLLAAGAVGRRRVPGVGDRPRTRPGPPHFRHHRRRHCRGRSCARAFCGGRRRGCHVGRQGHGGDGGRPRCARRTSSSSACAAAYAGTRPEAWGAAALLIASVLVARPPRAGAIAAAFALSTVVGAVLTGATPDPGASTPLTIALIVVTVVATAISFPARRVTSHTDSGRTPIDATRVTMARVGMASAIVAGSVLGADGAQALAPAIAALVGVAVIRLASPRTSSASGSRFEATNPQPIAVGVPVTPIQQGPHFVVPCVGAVTHRQRVGPVV